MLISYSANFGVNFIVLETYFLMKSLKNENSSLVMLLSRICIRNIVINKFVLTSDSSNRLTTWANTWQTLCVYPSLFASAAVRTRENWPSQLTSSTRTLHPWMIYTAIFSNFNLGFAILLMFDRQLDSKYTFYNLKLRASWTLVRAGDFTSTNSISLHSFRTNVYSTLNDIGYSLIDVRCFRLEKLWSPAILLSFMYLTQGSLLARYPKFSSVNFEQFLIVMCSTLSYENNCKDRSVRILQPVKFKLVNALYFFGLSR